MSNLHLLCFLNTDRPQLDQSSVTDLPIESLGLDLSSQLNDSLRVDKSNGYACAASGRLWETILEKHRLPYILLRVADMRFMLGSKTTALTLYQELQAALNDPHLERWIKDSQSSTHQERNQLLLRYKSPSAGFTPSQRWCPTAGDSFPYCKIESKKLQDLGDRWKNLESNGFGDRFLNMHCLETNYIEGTFKLDYVSNNLLVINGFYDKSKLAQVKNPLDGSVRSLDDMILILQDTHNALSEIYTFHDPNPSELTVEMVCRLHTQLMKTCRVIYDEGRHIGHLSYTNIGVTRQASGVNVSVTSNVRGHPMKVQFCPYDELEGELSLFCKRFNEIIRQNDMDPFACAAWISHTFVTIHPFEDGNGRLSRMLSSIPLVRKGLPPLCVVLDQKAEYMLHLNSTRARPRWGDYQGLMDMIYLSTKNRIDFLITEQDAKI